MKYLVTVEVRLSVQADNETDAEVKAAIGLLDPAAAVHDGTEWIGHDVVSCVKDK
jgi:hypothetical protein